MNQNYLRTPEGSTAHNNAVNIERYLQEDGHQIRGFVIYRCTYKSDADWAEFMKRLHEQTRRVLGYCNVVDMLDRLHVTVIEDRALFDNASTSAVREHFRHWAATAPQEEQGTGAGFAYAISTASRWTTRPWSR